MRSSCLQRRPHPGAAGFGEDVLELGELLVGAAHQQVPPSRLAVEGDLGNPQRLRHGTCAVVRRTLPGVLVDDQVVVLDGGQHPVPRRVVERFQPSAVGRDERQQHAAAQPRLGDELDVFDGFVQVVGQDQADARTAVGILRAEVLQPAIVGADAGQGQLKAVRRGRLGGDHALGVERRHRVREHHLADHALAVLVAGANLVVPVAHLLLAVVLLGGIAVAAPPVVEALPVAGVQVLAVLRVAAPGVGVGGDQKIGVVAHAVFLKAVFRGVSIAGQGRIGHFTWNASSWTSMDFHQLQVSQRREHSSSPIEGKMPSLRDPARFRRMPTERGRPALGRCEAPFLHRAARGQDVGPSG